MNKIIALTSALILAAALSGCVPVGDPLNETFTADIKDTDTISIDVTYSDVVIRPEDRTDLHIDYATYERGPELTLREGRTLRIEEELDGPPFISFEKSPKVTIKVPYSFTEALNIDASSGDIDLKDLELTSLAIHVSSGDIIIEDAILSDVDLDLSSGDLEAENVETDYLKIKTSSGDVDLINVTGEINGRSSSGDVFIEMTELMNDLDYSLSSGDFRLRLEEDLDHADVNLSCSSGDVDLDFDLDDYSKEEDNKVRGQVGDGKYDLDVHTSSGDVEVY